GHPEGDISIEFSGLRPGEKLFEELLIGSSVSKTSHSRIMRAEEGFIPWNLLKPEIAKMIHECREQNGEEIIQLLQSCVIEYIPGSTGDSPSSIEDNEGSETSLSKSPISH
ncbi:MAG: polysaccharide biosynthesis protein, partial [Bdellovibrionales bacterium]|nr:polysaccharide biosynthesis protein [Bdellovibrionales bacterium]